MIRKSFLFFVIASCTIVIIVSALILFVQKSIRNNESIISNSTFMNTLRLTSSAFEHNRSIPREYTCQGANTNPPLHITGVPESAQSLVLIVDDPDAPIGVWDHWLVWNIAPSTTDIAAHSVPIGALVGTTSSGGLTYEGPCPPSGTHHYRFTMYALSKQLSLPAGSDKQTVLAACNGFILDQFTLVGLYKKT